MKNGLRDKMTFVGFLIVPIILLILFAYYPLGKLIQISMSKWNGLSPTMEFVGLDNFKAILSNKDYMSVFANNMAYVLTAIAQQFVGLLLAILLDSNIKMKKSFRAVLFMPYIINGVAVAFMFNYMYDFTNSPINYLITKLGFNGIHFLSQSYLTNFSLSFISFWKYAGFTMVIYLAALQSIPKQVYEAARMDGANFFQTVRFITFPNVKRMFQISLLLSLNGALQAYFEPFLITKGGPNGRTDTFITKSLELAFDFNKYGKAAAFGVFLLGMIIVITLLQRVFLKEADV